MGISSHVGSRLISTLLLGLVAAGCGDDTASSEDPAVVMDAATTGDGAADGGESDAVADGALADALAEGAVADASADDATDGAAPDAQEDGQQDAMIPGAIVLPAVVTVPYVVAGTGGQSVKVPVSNPGSEAVSGIAWKLDGNAHLHLEGTPASDVAGGGSAELTIAYDGSATEELAGATLSATYGTAVVTAKVWAVAGDPEVGMATWEPVTGAGGVVCGEGTTLSLPTAPFPHDGTAWGDDSVRVFVPEGYRDVGAQTLVVHFHGFNTTLDATLAGHAYQEHVYASGANVILVLPQGPVQASSGDFGKLMHAGGLEAMVRQVVALLYREGRIKSAAIEDMVLTSHSGGYQAVATILAGTTLPISRVHLFDSLYGMASNYQTFVVGGGSIFSNFTATGGTDIDNLDFADDLTAAGVTVATNPTQRALRDTQAVISFADTTHNGVTRLDGIYGDAIRFGVRHHRRGPRIELRQAIVEGGKAKVRWLSPEDDELEGFRVETSADGKTWSLGAEVAADQDTATFDTLGVRVRVLPKLKALGPDQALASDTGRIDGNASVLVVDGFDRILGGSYGGLNHDFAARVGEAAGGAVTVSHRALVEDGFGLSGYPVVIWLSGDESTSDRSFSSEEQAIVSAYVQGGGRLIVSGSEVAYELGSLGQGEVFLNDVLGAAYAGDDAGSNQAAGTGALSGVGTFGFGGAGAPYPEDYPDLLTTYGESQAILTYGTGGIAAVGIPGKAALVGFPLEVVDGGALQVLVTGLVGFVKP